LLGQTVIMGGSDLHLTVGIPPCVRVNGSLTPLPDWPSLTPEQTQRLVRSALTEEQWQRFARDHEMDSAYGAAGVSRFRMNVYRQRGSVHHRYLPPAGAPGDRANPGRSLGGGRVAAPDARLGRSARRGAARVPSERCPGRQIPPR
jgi:hypothetical protein